MKTILLISLLLTISCDLKIEGNKNTEKNWAGLSGDCKQTPQGIASSDVCSFVMKEVAPDKEEINYKLKFDLTKRSLSYVDFHLQGNDSLSEAIVISMVRDNTKLDFFVSDKKDNNYPTKTYETLDNTDIVESLEINIRYIKKDSNQRLIISTQNGEIFDSNGGMIGPANMNSFKTAGRRFGFKIKNANVKNATAN